MNFYEEINNPLKRSYSESNHRQISPFKKRPFIPQSLPTSSVDHTGLFLLKKKNVFL